MSRRFRTFLELRSWLCGVEETLWVPSLEVCQLWTIRSWLYRRRSQLPIRSTLYINVQELPRPKVETPNAETQKIYYVARCARNGTRGGQITVAAEPT